MDLASLGDPSRVVFGIRANNKEQLLLGLASRAAALNLDHDAIFSALRAREELESTGFGEGPCRTPVSKDSIVSSVWSRG
ncbi:MAG: PTS sugar transporter subunit IIA [Methylocella sp.]